MIAGKTRGPGFASRVRSPGAPRRWTAPRRASGASGRRESNEPTRASASNERRRPTASSVRSGLNDRRRSSGSTGPNGWSDSRRSSGSSGLSGWSDPRRSSDPRGSSAWSVPSGSRSLCDPTRSSGLCGGTEMNPTLWMPRLRSIFPARGGDADTRAAPLTCLECLSDLPPTGRFCPECGAVAPARLFLPPRAPCDDQGLDAAADTPDAADAAWLTGAPALPGLEASRFPSRRRPLRATAYGLAAATVVLIGVFSAVASLAPSLRASPSARAPAMDDEVERMRAELRTLERQVDEQLRMLNDQLRATRSSLEREPTPRRGP